MAITPPLNFPVTTGVPRIGGPLPVPTPQPGTPDLSNPEAVATELVKLAGSIVRLTQGNPRLLRAAINLVQALSEGGPIGARKGPVVPPGMMAMAQSQTPPTPPMAGLQGMIGSAPIGPDIARMLAQAAIQRVTGGGA